MLACARRPYGPRTRAKYGYPAPCWLSRNRGDLSPVWAAKVTRMPIPCGQRDRAGTLPVGGCGPPGGSSCSKILPRSRSRAGQLPTRPRTTGNLQTRTGSLTVRSQCPHSTAIRQHHALNTYPHGLTSHADHTRSYFLYSQVNDTSWHAHWGRHALLNTSSH